MLWTMVLHLALTFKGGLGVVASFALFAFWAGQGFFCPHFIITCVFYG